MDENQSIQKIKIINICLALDCSQDSSHSIQIENLKNTPFKRSSLLNGSKIKLRGYTGSNFLINFKEIDYSLVELQPNSISDLAITRSSAFIQ